MTSRLVIDANVLVRCVIGRRAAIDAAELARKGVRLFTTKVQIAETFRVLVRVFGMSEDLARDAVRARLSLFSVINEAKIRDLEATSRQRFHERGEVDWPVLAAARAFEADIWTDDRDFFGIGVPIWSSRNVEFVSGSTA